jgi:hypothetical protein
MPRLPDAPALGERSIAIGRAPLVQDRSGEIAAAGLGQAADRIGSTVAAFAQRQDQLQYAKARSELLMADSAIRKELETDNDWQTYEQRYREKLGKARETASALVRSRSDKALFEQETTLDIERGAGAVRDLARRKEVDVGRADLNSILESNRRTALETTDKGLRDSLIASTQDAITGAQGKGYISAQEAVDNRQRWTSDYAEGYLDIQNLQERVRILQSPKGTPADFIQPDRRAVLLKAAQNKLRAEQERARSELRSALTDQMQDIAAAAQAGIEVKQTPSRASFVNAFGEKEGAQRFESARKLANMSTEIASLHGLSAEQLAEQAEAYRPKEVTGAAEQAQLYGVVGRAVSGILSERARDPAGYLLQHSQPVQRAWTAFQADPEKARDFLSAVRAEKDRMGIPGEAVLPDAYVQGIAEELNTAQTAEQLADRVESEVERWGAAWPSVQAQLGGKVSDLTLVMGAGIPRSASVALASTMKLKDSELKAMLPASTKWTDVEADVDGQFTDFQRSLPPEAARTWSAVRDSAIRLSVKYMNDGNSRSDAVNRAYQDLVEAQYQMTEFRGVQLRIPVAQDAEAVEIGARATLEGFTPDPGSIAVPPGAAVTAEEYAGTWQSYIRDNGYWITRPDAKGLRLYADGGPVIGASGPVDFTWEQLQELGSTKRASDEAARRERMRKEALKRQQMR